ncbi:hypothetical protein QJS66_15965 [Kocuria rhizophila]|nr:hypothetical protein QJS66_15965 [Kocuria rhizophila]
MAVARVPRVGLTDVSASGPPSSGKPGPGARAGGRAIRRHVAACACRPLRAPTAAAWRTRVPYKLEWLRVLEGHAKSGGYGRSGRADRPGGRLERGPAGRRACRSSSSRRAATPASASRSARRSTRSSRTPATRTSSPRRPRSRRLHLLGLQPLGPPRRACASTSSCAPRTGRPRAGRLDQPGRAQGQGRLDHAPVVIEID